MSLILIADDNPHAHRMGRQILSQEGHTVATVSDGEEAFEYLAHNRPDLVMVDTRMPGPSGYEVCSQIKRNPDLEGVKVVLLAGPLEPFDNERADSCGSDGVLHKPLDAFTLIETVNNLLGAPDMSVSREIEAQALAREAKAQAERSAKLKSRLDQSDNGPVAVADPPEPDFAAQLAQQSPDQTAPQPTVHPSWKPQDESAAEPEPEPETRDPFAAVVLEALSSEEEKRRRSAAVRAAVEHVLEAATPTLVDAITAQVLARLNKD